MNFNALTVTTQQYLRKQKKLMIFYNSNSPPHWYTFPNGSVTQLFTLNADQSYGLWRVKIAFELLMLRTSYTISRHLGKFNTIKFSMNVGMLVYINTVRIRWDFWSKNYVVSELYLKVPSGQIGSAWEWYHWKAL